MLKKINGITIHPKWTWRLFFALCWICSFLGLCWFLGFILLLMKIIEPNNLYFLTTYISFTILVLIISLYNMYLQLD